MVEKYAEKYEEIADLRLRAELLAALVVNQFAPLENQAFRPVRLRSFDLSLCVSVPAAAIFASLLRADCSRILRELLKTSTGAHSDWPRPNPISIAKNYCKTSCMWRPWLSFMVLTQREPLSRRLLSHLFLALWGAPAMFAEQEVLERDLEKFLESARLSKYMQAEVSKVFVSSMT